MSILFMVRANFTSVVQLYHENTCVLISFLGIPVAEFAMDGVYTLKPYINHTLGIGPNNLTDFTFCLRFKVNYLKPIVSYIISYTSLTADNTLTLDFEFNRENPSVRNELGLKVYIIKNFIYFSCLSL